MTPGAGDLGRGSACMPTSAQGTANRGSRGKTNEHVEIQFLLHTDVHMELLFPKYETGGSGDAVWPSGQ